jgi:polysaccharide pyruvyl transferase CsaB
MTISTRSIPNLRHIVIITGYYGFDNLGDEAILEELLHELSPICGKENIIVLSNQPEKTSTLYGVQSTSRWNWSIYIELLRQAKILISGGGGLFQDGTGPRSVLFYAAQIFLAKLFGAKVFIYAQGIGPIKNHLCRALSQLAFKQANKITLRDQNSVDIARTWSTEPELTADPVWALASSPLPNSILSNLDKITQPIIGLSLREAAGLKDYHLQILAQAIADTFSQSIILLLPLQNKQDLSPLKKIDNYLKELKVKTNFLDTSQIIKPSQWLALMEKMDLLIGMRFHALLMALKVSKPVIGIAYDPKIIYLLKEFNQPLLYLNSKNQTDTIWLKTIKDAKAHTFSGDACTRLNKIKIMAEKNAVLLAEELQR